MLPFPNSREARNERDFTPASTKSRVEAPNLIFYESAFEVPATDGVSKSPALVIFKRQLQCVQPNRALFAKKLIHT
jgi:hypothetical protein